MVDSSEKSHDSAASVASECAAYIEHIQNLLRDEKVLQGKYLPIEDFFLATQVSLFF